MKDFYSKLASEVFKMPYEECEEYYFDGTVNIEGKIRRSSIINIVNKLEDSITSTNLSYEQIIEIIKYLKMTGKILTK